MNKTAQGFSLLEVLVALLIIALILGSSFYVTAIQTQQQTQIEQQDKARWVARNVLADLRMQQVWPQVGQEKGQFELGHQPWHWVMHIAESGEQDLRQIDIQVYADSEDGLPVTHIMTLLQRP